MLSENMLALGRPGEDVKRRFRILDCLESSVRLIQGALPGSFEVNLESSDDFGKAQVLIDDSRFQQSVINMVLNAADAMEEGGRIDISASICEIDYSAYACIEIMDTGKGIPEDHLQHLTEPFFTTKKPGEGVGIGLAVVRSFAEDSEGILSFDYTLGKGTKVTLCIPLEDCHEAEIRCVRREQGAEGLRVLLVEDQDFLRDMLAQAIAGGGHEVQAFESAGNVLASDVVQEDDLDVLVVDVNLGDGNGVELVKLLEIQRDRAAGHQSTQEFRNKERVS